VPAAADAWFADTPRVRTSCLRSLDAANSRRALWLTPRSANRVVSRLGLLRVDGAARSLARRSMSADPKLVQVARAAELELRLPLLRLSTAGQFIVGSPGPSSRFREATAIPLGAELMQQLQRQRGRELRKGDALQRQHEADIEELRAGWVGAAELSEPDPPENLTLYEAVVWGWGESSGMRVPAVRVRLEAISAWWVGAGDEIKGKVGAGVFAFLSIPIGQ
jgi:hypothetical protein